MNDSTKRLLDHRLKLDRLTEDWQRKLAYGNDRGWRGDRALVLYVHQLTDEIEIWYELPNERPTLVMKLASEGFDIDMACEALRRADHRTSSVDEKLAEIDAANAQTEAAHRPARGGAAGRPLRQDAVGHPQGHRPPRPSDPRAPGRRAAGPSQPDPARPLIW